MKLRELRFEGGGGFSSKCLWGRDFFFKKKMLVAQFKKRPLSSAKKFPAYFFSPPPCRTQLGRLGYRP